MGLKSTTRKNSLLISRIESYATPGLPDVLCCSEDGAFSFMELKVVHGKSQKVALSGHQVAWQTRHSHANTFIVVRRANLDICVFLGASSTNLCVDGLDSVPALQVYSEPYDFEAFFALTCPVGKK